MIYSLGFFDFSWSFLVIMLINLLIVLTIKKVSFVDLIFYKIDAIAEKMCTDHIAGDSSFKNLISFLLFFILTCNLVGCFGFFPIFSILISPFFLAAFVFLIGLFYGFKKRGLKLIFGLVPSKVPLAFKPIFFFIELISFIFRPFSLAFRLLLNISVGHIIISYLFQLLLKLSQSIGAWSFLAIPFFGIIMAIELMAAFMQSYIFATFSSIIIGSCVNKESH